MDRKARRGKRSFSIVRRVVATMAAIAGLALLAPANAATFSSEAGRLVGNPPIPSRPALGDLDGDGDLEILSVTLQLLTAPSCFKLYPTFVSSSGLVVGEPAFCAVTTGLPQNSFSVGPPALADIDDDNDLDVFFVACLPGAGPHMFFKENIGSPSAPKFGPTVQDPFGIAPLEQGCRVVTELADLDGDNDLDLFAVGSHGFVMFENIGTPAAPAFAAPVPSPYGLTPSCPTFVDIDGDGDLDVIDSGLPLTLRENTGTPTVPVFGAPVIDPFGSPPIGRGDCPVLGDMDGDGDLDLFLGSPAGYFENLQEFTCPPVPAAVCDSPQASLLQIKMDGGLSRVRFSFRRGSPIDRFDLGNPWDNHYALCLYSAGTLVHQFRVPRGLVERWTTCNFREVTFRRGAVDFPFPGFALGGLPTTNMSIRGGPPEHPLPAIARWRSALVEIPHQGVFPLSAPVTAQVISSNGLCFGDTFLSADIRKNQYDPGAFDAVFFAEKP